MPITLASKVATYQIIVLPRARREPHPTANAPAPRARLRLSPAPLQPGPPALHHPSAAPLGSARLGWARLARRAASRPRRSGTCTTSPGGQRRSLAGPRPQSPPSPHTHWFRLSHPDLLLADVHARHGSGLRARFKVRWSAASTEPQNHAHCRGPGGVAVRSALCSHCMASFCTRSCGPRGRTLRGVDYP